MIVSLNEVETTILKAARGAGMEWGLAEEAAQAAIWLVRCGLPWEAPALGVLEAAAWQDLPVLEGPHLRPRLAGGRLCPILCGAYLSDLGGGLALMEQVAFPILLLPFATRCACALELAWGDVSIGLIAGRASIRPKGARGLDAPQAALVTLRPVESELPEPFIGPARPRGVTVDARGWAKLQALEARTYVAASSRSRRSGAGPGSVDD